VQDSGLFSDNLDVLAKGFGVIPELLT